MSDDTIVQPDLGFVVAERAGILRDYVMGPPDLAIEIAHVETAALDQTKLTVYARNGVREAWLVDPEAESVTLFFGDGANWAEETSVLFGEPVPSRVVAVGDAGLGQFKTADG